MLIGYARTSTVDQEAGLGAQETELARAGCERVFVEQVSAVALSRPELEKALAFLRTGDALVVAKLDRLARSVEHMLEIVERIDKAGAALRIMNLGLDTGTPTGRLMLTMLGAVAEFERAIMLERQRVGISKAKADGKYRGRKPTAQAKASEVAKLKGAGVGPAEIARRLNIGRASVYRILDTLTAGKGGKEGESLVSA